jgi:hypothetical protein
MELPYVCICVCDYDLAIWGFFFMAGVLRVWTVLRNGIEGVCFGALLFK